MRAQVLLAPPVPRAARLEDAADADWRHVVAAVRSASPEADVRLAIPLLTVSLRGRTLMLDLEDGGVSDGAGDVLRDAAGRAMTSASTVGEMIDVLQRFVNTA